MKTKENDCQGFLKNMWLLRLRYSPTQVVIDVNSDKYQYETEYFLNVLFFESYITLM